MTDWAVRALTSQQLEYAALDAAVTPRLTERVLESIEARVSMDHLLQVGLEQKNESNNNNNNNNNNVTTNSNNNVLELLNGPVIQRRDGDDAFVKEIVSWRFLLLPENTDEMTISELQAKQIVGSSWVASSVWTAVQTPPPPYVVPPVVVSS